MPPSQRTRRMARLRRRHALTTASSICVCPRGRKRGRKKNKGEMSHCGFLMSVPSWAFFLHLISLRHFRGLTPFSLSSLLSSPFFFLFWGGFRHHAQSGHLQDPERRVHAFPRVSAQPGLYRDSQPEDHLCRQVKKENKGTCTSLACHLLACTHPCLGGMPLSLPAH